MRKDVWDLLTEYIYIYATMLGHYPSIQLISPKKALIDYVEC